MFQLCSIIRDAAPLLVTPSKVTSGKQALSAGRSVQMVSGLQMPARAWYGRRFLIKGIPDIKELPCYLEFCGAKWASCGSPQLPVKSPTPFYWVVYSSDIPRIKQPVVTRRMQEAAAKCRLKCYPFSWSEEAQVIPLTVPMTGVTDSDAEQLAAQVRMLIEAL